MHTSKTKKALIKLGLDVKTGISPVINIKDLEFYSMVRHNSNGSRIIRDDAYPFSCFNIERKYEGVELKSVEFKGYRTVSDEKKKIQVAIEKKNKLIRALLSKIHQDEDLLKFLKSCDESNNIYSEVDFK